MDFIRVRASTDGTETISCWTGDVYGWEPDGGPHHLFGFEGLNVARAVQVDDGWQLLTREAALYLDPAGRDVLDVWDNPLTGRRVEVRHVFNDPVNLRFGDRPVPVTRLGDQVVFNVDVRLAYPSPLKVADYPDNSAGDTYRALELFQFFAGAGELDSGKADVPSVFSWCRVSPWLPWMAMAQRPGRADLPLPGRQDHRGARAAARARRRAVPARARALVGPQHDQLDGLRRAGG